MISDTINGVTLHMNTAKDLFSPAGLDLGTRAMLEVRPAEAGEKVLDLCAAPGGKSGQIGAALMGQGFLLSNRIIGCVLDAV